MHTKLTNELRTMLDSRLLVFITLSYIHLCPTHKWCNTDNNKYCAVTPTTTDTEAQRFHTQRSFSGKAQSVNAGFL